MFASVHAVAGMPDWASKIIEETDLSQAPEDTEVWRLLDRTKITITQKGEFKVQRHIVQYAVREAGADEAGIFLIDGDEDAVDIVELNGWHRKKAGGIKSLSRKNVVTVGRSTARRLETGSTTIGYFGDTNQGSWVVFESEEIHRSMFSITYLSIADEVPIRRREISIRAEGDLQTFFIHRNLDHWKLDYQHDDHNLVVSNLPALENESFAPDFPNPYPMAVLGYKTESDKLQSWDSFAKWTHDMFARKSKAAATEQLLDNKEAVAGVVQAMRDGVSYRQRYLSYARGWEPASGEQVERRAYGDCKDMVSCFAYKAKSFQVLPALTSIGDGWKLDENLPVGPIFNHVIVALPLKSSLGFAAEVEVAGGRYLLVDPTDPYTPLGKLGSHYKDRKVLICRAEGAAWADIPETAVEAASIKVSLTGFMDDQFTYRGTVTIAETGDAYGFRTLSNEGNDRNLLRHFQQEFDVPAPVDFELKEKNIAEDGTVRMVFQVAWPSFMRRDLDGFRMPSGLVYSGMARMNRVGKERTFPIHLSGLSDREVSMVIRCKSPISAGSDQASWSNEYRGFEWSSSYENQILKINFKRSGKEGFFEGEAIQEGKTMWQEYRRAYLDFFTRGALFKPVG